MNDRLMLRLTLRLPLNLRDYVRIHLNQITVVVRR